MGGNAEKQAQQFLEDLFGEGNEYFVEDGVYGKWMNTAIKIGDKDYATLHIEIERLDPLALRIIRITFYVSDPEEDDDDFSPDVEQILEDVQAYGTEWELAMMEFGTVMIDIKSNYEVEDEGLIDKENVPDLAKIKNVIMKIKKTVDSHKKK